MKLLTGRKRKTECPKKLLGLPRAWLGRRWAEQPVALPPRAGPVTRSRKAPSAQGDATRALRLHLSDVAAGPGWAHLPASQARHAGHLLHRVADVREGARHGSGEHGHLPPPLLWWAPMATERMGRIAPPSRIRRWRPRTRGAAKRRHGGVPCKLTAGEFPDGD